MATDGVSREALEGLISDYEGALRASCGKEGLPDEWQANLLSISRDTPSGLLKYWKWLAIYSEMRHRERAQARAVDAGEAQEAARALLTRTPERVRLASGRTVLVTGRSYAAMMELAAHQNRIELLRRDLNYIGARYQTALSGQRRWRGARREARRMEALYRRTATEMMRHRERLYANAMTPSGAAARIDEPAPAWWTEATLEDDSQILVALYKVGPLRYAQMGPAPEVKREREPKENWGYAGLLASWGVRKKVEPAAMFDADFGQVLAEARVSAPPSLDEAME